MNKSTLSKRTGMLVAIGIVLIVAASATILVAYLSESQEMTIVQGLTVTVEPFPEVIAGETYDLVITFDNVNAASISTWSVVDIEPPEGCDNVGITGSWYKNGIEIGPGNTGITFIANNGISTLTYKVITDSMLVGGQYNFIYSVVPS